VQITPEPNVPVTQFSMTSIPMLERARLACNTMRALFPDDTDPPSEDDKELAREAFQDITAAKNPRFVPAIVATYPNATMRHLDNLLSEYDHELVNSAVRIREYVKNKLLEDSASIDGKLRIKALELLGKMKDVGLFTDRVEITHKTKTDEELEAELTKKLERFMGAADVVDAEEVEDEEEELVDDAPTEPENRPTPMSDLINRLTPDPLDS